MTPHEAAHVARFMAKDCPKVSPSGNWKLETFTITQEEAEAEELRAAIRAARRGGFGADRWTPVGTYVALRRRFEREDFLVEKFGMERIGWDTMMSDTPNEIEDHGDPITHATGRVLVHGLGLGCIVAGLLRKPDVTHIDVVEIDQEVIDLTGHYYAKNPRVTIHHGDALTYSWGDDMRWNYVWHDIWLKIASDNLHVEKAENGISYGRLLREFEDRCDRQDAWAYEEAKQMDVRGDEEQVSADELVERWRTLSHRERANLVLQSQVRVTPGMEGPDPEAIRERAEVAAMRGERSWETLVNNADEWAGLHVEITDVEAMLILGFYTVEDAIR